MARPKPSSLMGSNPTMQLYANWEILIVARSADRRTTGPKTVIFPSDDERARRSGSGEWKRCRNSPRSTPTSIITSIWNAASSIARPSKNVAQPHWPSGNRSPAKRPEHSPISLVERRVRTRLTAPPLATGADQLTYFFRQRLVSCCASAICARVILEATNSRAWVASLDSLASVAPAPLKLNHLYA